MPTVRYPNTWAAGGLFAFSGLDGPTDYYRPLVASLLDDQVGMSLHVDPPVTLHWPITIASLDHSRCLMANDVLELYRVGEVEPALSLAFLDKDTLVGLGEPPAIEPASPARTFVPPPAGTLAWAREGARFCVAFAESAEAAAARAHSGLVADPGAVVAERKAFFARLPEAPSPDPARRAAYYKAWSVLKCNTYAPQGVIGGYWTTPDRWPHRHMWLWDSAFHALALRRLPGSIGADSVRAVLERQKEDGYIPHVMSPSGEDSSPFTQPPVLAWAVWKVYQAGADRSLLEWAYPRLGRYVAWDRQQRDRDGDGLLEWAREENEVCRCGESGMDNSPRFDTPGQAAAIDFNSMLAAEYQSLAKMAAALGLAAEAVAWCRQHEQLAATINARLWSEEDGLYLDANEQGLVRVPSSASFLPLYAGVATRERAERLAAALRDERRFWRPLPVPSVAADHPSYSDDMWRGPVWLNSNYLIVEGLARYGYRELAREIAERTVSEVSRWYARGGCLYEYYDAEAQRPPWTLTRKRNTGIGVIRDYGWSAAIYIELMHYLAGEVLG